MSDASLIVISVDGLRASALGAYGNTWYATPALDQLAAEATVYSQLLGEHWTPDELWRDLWGASPGDSGTPLLLGADRFSGRTLLVTDDADLTEHAAAKSFDEAVLVPSQDPQLPADSADETGLAVTLSALLDAIETRLDSNQPLLAWGHLRFASGPWDAPLEAVEALIDEDDPHPEPSVTPPSGDLAQLDNPDDARFLATLRYAAQVAALDQCLGMTVAALDSLLKGRPFTLAVLGTRGLALGEHGALGADLRPYNEGRQLPLLVRRADSRSHQRLRELLTSADVPRLLLGDGRPPRELAVLRSTAGHAVQDEHWKLYSPGEGEPELYSKPDDGWEINDVAVRQPHQVELLEERLAAVLATASEKPA
ncbi:Sulfatase [Posidoniimonas corsicana]|uniref:Sulfatase n=1 Tax=Posidoniimonas corsicana TaxID=1938618 RepID=A0A5C5VBQ7_9BACT|nr:hypothetical protein [Posidoniimonas corsicana]TWT35701.1 Sulfatase [Posidoniimonas corsicana]